MYKNFSIYTEINFYCLFVRILHHYIDKKFVSPIYRENFCVCFNIAVDTHTTKTPLITDVQTSLTNNNTYSIMKELTIEELDFLRYALDVYIFESGNESEEVLLLRDKLISICTKE